jgi:hypothetical protein
MKGRRIRTASDPTLAKVHAAAATVTLIQPTLHKTFGVINLNAMRYWPLHARLWRRAHDRVAELDARLLNLLVDDSNHRQADLSFTEEIYSAGVDLVVQAILCVQYLVFEIEQAAKLPALRGDELSARFSRALTEIGLSDLLQTGDWAGFIEINKYRDAVNHPKETNVYGADEGAWRNVPLAWAASDAGLDASSRLFRLMEKAAATW